MELGSKNLSVAIGFIGKTTNAFSLKCMMEFDDIVKTFGSDDAISTETGLELAGIAGLVR